MESKKYVYINEETDKVSIYESCIKEISFNQSETVFYIDWSQGYGDFLVRCSYPESVEYNFTTKTDKPNNIVLNHLEITDFSYLKDENGYTIQFNFDNYPIGYIRMHCTKFCFESPSLPLCSGENGHRIPWDKANNDMRID